MIRFRMTLAAALLALATIGSTPAMAACGANETPVYRVTMVPVWTPHLGWVVVPRVTIAYCALK